MEQTSFGLVVRNKSVFIFQAFWRHKECFQFGYLDPDLSDPKTQREQLPGNIIAPLHVIILQLITMLNNTQS